MMSLKNFVIFVLVACLLFPASSVYGHGFGIDTISSVDVQGKQLTISSKILCERMLKLDGLQLHIETLGRNFI